MPRNWVLGASWSWPAWEAVRGRLLPAFIGAAGDPVLVGMNPNGSGVP
jgi:hypothetical protein